jgi:hypothetical protein
MRFRRLRRKEPIMQDAAKRCTILVVSLPVHSKTAYTMLFHLTRRQHTPFCFFASCFENGWLLPACWHRMVHAAVLCMNIGYFYPVLESCPKRRTGTSLHCSSISRAVNHVVEVSKGKLLATSIQHICALHSVFHQFFSLQTHITTKVK